MQKILITGATGLVGSRIVEILSPRYEFLPITRAHGADITNAASLARFENLEAEWVLHLAGKTDVDGCEKDKDLGENGEAWRMNVTGTKNIVEMCKRGRKKLIYFSTDFVFDGKKPEGEAYTEEDTPNPVNWYALTKYESEKIVQDSGLEFLILRLAYPYRREFELKSDFVRTIINRLKANLEVNAITDHIICPTFIDDIARVIQLLINSSARGVFHTVGATPISPFDAAREIASVFALNADLIKDTTREKYFAGRGARPFNLYLKNDKINKVFKDSGNLGFEMTAFSEGLNNLK